MGNRSYYNLRQTMPCAKSTSRKDTWYKFWKLFIKKADLDIMNCCSQDYVGASNISSEAVICFNLYHSIRAGCLWGHCWSNLKNINWDMFRKTGVLELSVKILEKYLKEVHFKLQTPINRLFEKRGVFTSYPASLLKMNFSIGIFHEFSLQISHGNSQNTFF